MLRIEGQLAFTKQLLFGQFIFHKEPVLDQTMTNLRQNTIGLEFLDFNRILYLTWLVYIVVIFDDALFNYARREIITSDFTTSYLMT